MVDLCIPIWQHCRYPSRVHKLVVVVITDDSAQTGNDGSVELVVDWEVEGRA